VVARAVAVALVLGCSRTSARAAALSELEVKAAFLYHFTQYVQWPTEGSPNGVGAAPFVVAVWQADPFREVATRMLAGKSAQSRPLQVVRISEPSEGAEAKVLFLGSTEPGGLTAALRAVEGTAVLTVGDAPGFAELGGMIGFRIVDDRVRFDINLEQASRRGFRISSEVVKLARVVRTRREP
jgi:hypothetical protein